MPSRAHDTDSGWDLSTLEDAVVGARPIIIKTGVHLGLPAGVDVQVRPRSSTALKFRICCALGTIDNGYTGDIGIVCWVINHSSPAHDVVVPKGTRLAQLVFSQVTPVTFDVVEEVSSEGRGDAGFGSSGVA